MSALLEVENLHVHYGAAHVLKDVSLRVESGDVLGLVGESGSGKTTLGMAVLQLLPEYARVDGTIRFDDRDLASLPARELRRLRGERISAVFQDPLASLDPAFTVGDQIVEVIRAHRSMAKREARAEAVRWLREVGIPAPEARLGAYAHELSGGMAQRMSIAMALALNPALLIADEPTSALDVTVQMQILQLLRTLISDHAGAVMLITHDLGVVARLCTRVAVMYGGEIVEEAPVRDLFANPRHEHTRQLLASLPGRSRRARRHTEVRA